MGQGNNEKNNMSEQKIGYVGTLAILWHRKQLLFGVFMNIRDGIHMVWAHHDWTIVYLMPRKKKAVSRRPSQRGCLEVCGRVKEKKNHSK